MSSTRITTVTDPLSAQWITISDRSIVRITEQHDPIGRTTYTTYDSLRRVQTSASPTGQLTTYVYDSRGNITSTTISSGAATISTSATYPLSCATDPIRCNLPATTTDARGYTTNYTYAAHGGVLTVLAPDPDGGGSAARPQTTYAYAQKNARYFIGPSEESVGSPIHVPTTVSACSTTTVSSCPGTANETITSFAYPASDVLNNLLPLTSTVAAGNPGSPLVAITTPTYDNVGNVTAVMGPLGGAADTTRYDYDANRQVIGVFTPDPDNGGPNLNRAVKTTYNDDGQPISVQQGTINSSFAWSSFIPIQEQTTTYNAQGRGIRTDVVLRYGTNGASAAIRSVVQNAYDNAGRLDCQALRLTLASIPASACTGGGSGAGTDRLVKFDYNAAGQVTSATSAFGTSDARTEITHYASNGQVDWMEDGNGNRTAYEYDLFGRLYRTYFPSQTVGAHAANPNDYEQYTYDANGNVTGTRLRSTQTIAGTYDALDRATFIDMPNPQANVGIAYDNLSRMTSQFISGHSVTFAYDALSRMTSTVTPLGTVTYQYDLAGRRTQMNYPGSPSFYLTYDYNNTDEVTAIRRNAAVSGADVLATYAYDNLGRRASMTRAGGAGASTTFTYDNDTLDWSLAHNLDGSGTGNDVTLNFSVNAAGQIVGRERLGSNSAYTYAPATGSTLTDYSRNGLNQMTTQNAASLTYDGRGNTTSNGALTFGYDFTNRLTSSGGNTLSYDPLGRLYQTVIASVTTRFLYDGSEIIAEYDGSGTPALQRRYVRGPGLDDAIVWFEGSGAADPRWLLPDERGSVIALANASAGMININTYDEYGSPAAGNLGRFQYTGQAWLSGLGIYHYKARAYDPTVGRFLQTDPLEYAAGDMNLYAYVGNDSVNGVDPFGLQEDCRGPWCGEDTTVSGCGQECRDLRARAEAAFGQINTDYWLHRYDGLPLGQYDPTLDPMASGHADDATLEFASIVAPPLRAGRAAPLARPLLARMAALFGCGCFVEGTLVATPDGLRPIEEIAVGDIVMAWDPETGEITPQQVTALIRPEPKLIWRLEARDADGEAEVFEVTNDHPWYIEGAGWVETQHLQVGQHIETADDRGLTILDLARTDRVERIYNLTVDGPHTFLVGKDRAVVHNGPCTWLINVTRRSLIHNAQINLTRAEFAANLRAGGWSATQLSNGAVRFTNPGSSVSYVVRGATSTPSGGAIDVLNSSNQVIRVYRPAG
jgi:RHS repeat-associated protein